MSSITWAQLTDDSNPRLSIPDGLRRLSIVEAAISYAESGWYVLPINSRTKHAGSFVGKDWPNKSMRDPDQIKRIFDYPDISIALHVGRSGAIAFDVDHPSNLTSLLERELLRPNVPFQSTRLIGDSRRGHYLFGIRSDQKFGNGVGDLANSWGDVRGSNGIVVASPSSHSNEFGFYEWKIVGDLPMLPSVLADKLPKIAGEYGQSMDNSDIQIFINEHSGNLYPELLEHRLRRIQGQTPSMNGRHTFFLKFICLVLKDVSTGMYSASVALIRLNSLFNSAKNVEEQTPNEFGLMVSWALGQISCMSIQAKGLHAFESAPHLHDEILEWVHSRGN